jgi:DNA-binding NtrC family response regulator
VAAIWIVSEESSLAAILAHHVSDLGETWLGTPERPAFKDAPPADLLVLVGVTQTGASRSVLEKLLAFVRGLPSHRRVPSPVLFVAAPGAGAGATRLFDDRAAGVIEFPFDPEALAERAAALLTETASPASLRERARQLWVRAEVERQYAGLDLPALRQAVDPRNAHRPVLFLGEPGSRCGLLARYVHNFAEPVRDDFVLLSLADVAPGTLERSVLERTAGRRTTVYLPRLERAPRALQEELAHLLDASGALAVEPIRWLAAAIHPLSLSRSLRELSWLRVELPPLRTRADRSALIGAALRAAGERHGRDQSLDAAARTTLEAYPWPGNLAELDRVLDLTVGASDSHEIHPADLRLAPARIHGIGVPQPAAAAPVAPAPAAAEEPPLVEAEPLPEPDPLHEPAPEPEREAEPEIELVDEVAEPELLSDEDLMLATLESPAPAEPDPSARLELEPEPEAELEPEPPRESVPPAAPAQLGPSARSLLAPLAQEIRKPLRAVRTYASLVEQRPHDSGVRRELRTLVEEDLGGLDETLQRVERFLRFGPPSPRPFELAPALSAELDARQSRARARELVVLRELDFEAPPLVADEAQIRFAFGALLDRALQLVPRGGDVYLGSAWSRKREEGASGHRVLLRFHSPEDVLANPTDESDAAFVEVVMAREIVQRAGGSFAVDASGPQDNVILVELPG